MLEVSLFCFPYADSIFMQRRFYIALSFLAMQNRRYWRSPAGMSVRLV
jgi:hypothetical protein